jgi:uncharacterized protein (DUF2132 family)
VFSKQENNPLHGLKLEQIITYLVNFYGWEQLSYHVPINCFKLKPSLKSSLTFLRKTPWAREKTETLFIRLIENIKDESLFKPL